MKFLSLVLVVCGLGAGALRAVSFSVDAGVAQAQISGTAYLPNPKPSVQYEDTSALCPVIGATVGLNDTWSLRLGYTLVGDLRSDVTYPFPPSEPGQTVLSIVVPMRYESDIHLVTFGPRYSVGLRPGLRAYLAAEGTWVHAEETSWLRLSVLNSTTLVEREVLVAPYRSTEDAVRLGGSVGVEWSVSRRWSIDASYRYVDADPSWHREVHLFGLGIRFDLR